MDWPTGALDLMSIPWGKIDSEEPFMGNPIISSYYFIWMMDGEGDGLASEKNY